MKEQNYLKIKEIFNNLEGVRLEESKNGGFKFSVYPDMKEMDVPIENLNLTVRSNNCLRRAKINTISELVTNMRSSSDIAKLRCCGAKSVSEIMEAVFLYQLSCLKAKDKEKYILKVIEMNSNE